MIWQLVREQLRAGRGYLAWTAGLLALTITLATYGTLTIVTRHDIESQAAQLTSFIDREFLGQVQTAGEPNESAPAGDEYAADNAAPSLAAVDAAIEEAIEDGSDVVARRDFHVSPVRGVFLAIQGDYDWDAALVRGAPPEAGQVAVTANYAEARGFEIGDPGELRPSNRNVEATSGHEAPDVELTISGLAHTPVSEGNYSTCMPSGYVAWEDTAWLAKAFSREDFAPDGT